MLAVALLPAAHGDALWIEYGAARTPRRLLVDCGPAHTYESGLRAHLAALPERQRRVELFVVTHIDADHIDGALILLQDRDTVGFDAKEIWFNAWEQLPRSPRDTFAPLQGEFLSGLMSLDDALAARWNTRFDRGPVVVDTGDDEPLPTVTLDGGARVTLLGPGPEELRRLGARWSAAIRDFSPGDANEAVRRLRERRQYRAPAGPPTFSIKSPGTDRTPANGSSISFLLEHGDRSVLLTGDAHARTLAAHLGRLCRERGVPRLAVSAVKLPHHGSVANLSAEWLTLVDTPHWLVSTNGAIFGHPDAGIAELIASTARIAPTFHCNYRCQTTERLADGADGRWRVVFPGDGAGLRLELEPPPLAKKPRTRVAAARKAG